jgi:aldose 1-epimerase
MAVRITAPPPFSQWVVYRPHLGSEFISLEPYTWVHNAPNLAVSPDLTGLARLEPGQEVEARIIWEIED